MFVPTTTKGHIACPIRGLRLVAKNGGRLIAPLLGFRRPDFGTRFAELASEWKSQQRFCAFAAAPVH